MVYSDNNIYIYISNNAMYGLQGNSVATAEILSKVERFQ